MTRRKKVVKTEPKIKKKADIDNVQPEYDEDGVLIQKNVFPPIED